MPLTTALPIVLAAAVAMAGGSITPEQAGRLFR